ncbi:MAG: hypothetical protein K6D03_09055 [Solobacterium sp.]|nr:hypothetical protein [Solobacterium sp.]
MKRALVFGGAFNPPTRAHIELADYARRSVGFDYVIFVPTKKVYIREDQGKDFAFDDQTRLDMLGRIASSKEWMQVSDYEICAGKQPRTYETLCRLKETTGMELKLLFGSDKLEELQTGWKYVDGIMREFGVVCMVRNNDRAEELIENDAYLKSLSPYITVVATPEKYQSTSSTEVRKEIVRYQEIKCHLEQMVPEELEGLKDYIGGKL